MAKKRTSKTELIRALEKKQMEREVLLSSILTDEQLYMTYGTQVGGFSSEQAEEILDEKGPNIIEEAKPTPVFVKFLLSFTSPFSIVLLLVAAVSFITEMVTASEPSWATVIIIVTLVVVSGVVQFVQEFKSDNAARRLKEMVSSNTAVLRDSKVTEIPMHDVVPGDIVHLSAGDMLPADLRILFAKDLFIGQAALTGESEPVEKFSQIKAPPKTALEAVNIGFMGTNVVSGAARAIVIATGNHTYLGTLARELTGKKAQTSFERGISDVSGLLLRLMLIMVPVIFLINGFTKNDWVSAFLFAMSVAVGITPELLPMIMTSTLAKGALTMAKHKTIVKNLSSIQSFGAMDVLCTDKTGTLTQDKIVLEKYLDVYGNDDRGVLKHTFLNSYFQTGMKNLMDLAIIERARKEGNLDWFRAYRKIDEIPFDFNRRRMSVVLQEADGEKRQLITKGAVEEMLKICSYALYQGKAIPLDDSLKAEALKISDTLNEEGLRVIAVAQKNKVAGEGEFSVNDEARMVLMGFVGFLDPPKESAKQAIEALRGHGVRVVVLTGDNEKVAATVCKKVGLSTPEALLGSDVDAMNDNALGTYVERVNLFAKLSPAQKARVVRVLQENDHVIGYLGDGINDAPALHQADVGISVDGAVDIAKESAHIILLEKSLMVLEEGVIEGRRTFGNIVKYIKMAASGNFGNMFSVLAASVFLPFLPMLPIQILIQNLLYDFSQIAIPLDRMDEDYIKQPQKWNAKGIARFMFGLGPVSSLFDIFAFVVLFFVFKYNTTELAPYFQTGWFIMGLLSQTLIVHLIRTRKVPFFESRASFPLLASTLLVSIAGIALPYTYVGEAVSMAPVSVWYLPCVFAMLSLYAVTVQFIKVFYVRKFGEWI
ncbi:MAG: magnesium-translocating P-type ATPase [Clostridiales bacterium]|nr:magnesium-translocating P-type ATPase [Clostridiales bacterium]